MGLLLPFEPCLWTPSHAPPAQTANTTPESVDDFGVFLLWQIFRSCGRGGILYTEAYTTRNDCLKRTTAGDRFTGARTRTYMSGRIPHTARLPIAIHPCGLREISFAYGQDWAMTSEEWLAFLKHRNVRRGAHCLSQHCAGTSCRKTKGFGLLEQGVVRHFLPKRTIQPEKVDHLRTREASSGIEEQGRSVGIPSFCGTQLHFLYTFDRFDGLHQIYH